MDVMKKILSIFTAGLALLSVFSCVKDDELVYYDLSNATAPVIQKYEVGDDGVSVQFSPASFGFNDNMVKYALAIISVDGSAADEALSSSVKEGVVSVSNSTITKTLIAMGKEEGSVVNLTLALRASMPGASDYIQSGSTIDIQGFEIAKGNPWGDYTETSTWSLIGAISSVGMNWDGDILASMTSDGMMHVVRNVKLAASDQFKFRKDAAWGENFGAPGDVEPYVLTLETPIEATAGGKNLAVPEDGNYDVLLNLSDGTITISEAFQTYPGYDETSSWSVIGAIASFEMNWDKDIAMITDGTWHVAEGVVLTTDDQFKFRKDQAWGENFGAEGDVEPFVVALDTEYPAKGGGKNLAVPADGTYDLLVNPDEGLYMVVESLGGKSGLIGGDEPDEPDEPAATTYSIIGDFNEWNGDVDMTEESGVWTGYLNVTAEGGTTFKIRKDYDWAVSYGATEKNYTFYGDSNDVYKPEYGTAFAATATDAANVFVDAGFYKIVLDLTDENAPMMTVTNAETWSLIGDFNSWSGDVDMTEQDGVWTSPVTAITAGGLKIRHNHDWTLSVGGTMESLGVPFEAVSENGPNIAIPEDGNYIVVYDTNEGTITVSTVGWGVVGSINDWGGSLDTPMKAEADHSYLVARNVAVTASDEIKIRYNNDWAVNYGAATSLGHAVKAEKEGANIKPGIDGAVDVYFFERDEVIIVTEAGADVTYWGLVGTVNGWAHPDYIMHEDENGVLVYEGLAVTADDEIKIRQNEAWDVNRGGAFGSFGEAFAAEDGGANIKIGQAATINVAYNAAEETITVTGEYDMPENLWSVIGDFNGWAEDAYMTEVLPGIWVSNVLNLNANGWKIRYNNSWDVNRGAATAIEEQGAFVKAKANGDNITLEGSFKVVYNANNETIGTLSWGVIGSIASIGLNWDNDVPMNLGTDGKWYSFPVVLATGDEFKIRKDAAWDENRGGTFVAADEAFAVEAGGANIKVAEDGTYMLVYDPAEETITLSKQFWGMIGDFNEWGADVFMMPLGDGVWAAYGQAPTGGWKIRQGAGWDVNRGGTFAASGEAIAAEAGGANIDTGGVAIDVVYDSAAETITVTVQE